MTSFGGSSFDSLYNHRTNKNTCTRVADQTCPQIKVSWRQPGDFGRSQKGLPIHNLTDLLVTVQRELPHQCSATRDCLANLPDWFRNLGAPEGIVALERRLNHTIPEPLRLFYRYPAAGCWLLAHHDTDILLEDSPLSERPHLVRWYGRPHLVIAELTHSQLVLGVQLDSDNPRIEWGDDGARCPLDNPAQYFMAWLTRIAEKIIDSSRREGVRTSRST